MDTVESIFSEAEHLANCNGDVVVGHLLTRISSYISRQRRYFPPTCYYRQTCKKLRLKEKRITRFAETKDVSFDRAVQMITQGNYYNTYLPLVVRRWNYHRAVRFTLVPCGQCLSCLVNDAGIPDLESNRVSRRAARKQTRLVVNNITPVQAPTAADLSSAFAELVSGTSLEEKKVNCG